MKLINKILSFLSGEWILWFQANGGTPILLRSMWVTVIVYTSAVCVRGLMATGTTWQFDTKVIRQLVYDTLPWAGAIYGGVYAALYTRFSSQWTYLAETYNQLMCCQIENPPDRKNEAQFAYYASWKAGIVEDAEDLHLATKPMFSWLLSSLLSEPEVCNAFEEYAHGGRQRLERLAKKLKRSTGRSIILPPSASVAAAATGTQRSLQHAPKHPQ